MSNSSIQWRLANNFGIWMGNGWKPSFPETAADAWNSGHVNDVLLLEGKGLLAATDAGGVWFVAEDGSLPQCLTNFLSHSTFNSLASGVFDPLRQIYAGGFGFYTTDLSSPDPLFNWIRIPLPDEPMVWRVLVLMDRIVLACDNGILWSPAPPPSSKSYHWKKAEVKDVTAPNFWGLAAGVQHLTQTANGMIFSPEIMAGGGGGDCNGLFWGNWDKDGVLKLTRASLLLAGIGRADSLEDTMAPVSVASCESDRRYAYALCARSWPGDTPHFFAVVRSNDGGRSWAEVGTAVEPEVDPAVEPVSPPFSLAELAGHHGDYNNCIAVSRWDPDIVAFGFTNTFLSFNRGESWQPIGIDYAPPRHLHVDIHGLAFTDRFPGAVQDLMVSSDGGVAAIRWGASPWMIESDHASDGVHGDFEALVLERNTMMHYTRRSDDLGAGFKIATKVEDPAFPNRATGGGCMIVSDYWTNGRKNYDAVILEGNELVHYWTDNSTSPAKWNKAQVISSHATGPGCIIQSDFVTSSHSNFEVVVQEGSNLVHYWHEGPNRSGPWHRTATPITTHAASAACFIQSDFGSGGHGNFELVVLEDSFGASGAGMVHYWRDNSSAPYPWNGPTMIDRNATSQGCLFRSDYGSGDHANFELIVQTGRELANWYRDNSAFPYPWRFARTIVGPGPENKATGPGCAFQGSYLFNRFVSNHGQFELAACVDGKVTHYYVDYVEPPLTGWLYGGLISNRAHTFRSSWNRHLPTLEFYPPATGGYTDPPGTGYSTLGVSSLVPGLVGSGLQDNGVLYATAEPGSATPWFTVQGGDGGAAAFLAARTPFENLPAAGHVLIEFNNEEQKPKDPSGVRSWPWDSSQARLIRNPMGSNVIPLRKVNPKASPVPVPKVGLLAVRMEAVTEPEYPRNPERARRGLMCAVGATGPDVYGLFVDGAEDEANTKPILHWDYIGTVTDPSGSPLAVDALASRDGFTIVVSAAASGKFSTATADQIFVMNSDTGNTSVMDMDPALGPLFATAIVVASRYEAYAITSLSQSFPVDPTPTTGQVIRWDGIRWHATAKLPIPPDADDKYIGELYGITADLSHSPPVVFVASERNVWVSVDRGATWMGASQGLPPSIQCADIRWVKNSGGSQVYLSTYGRSVWMAPQTVG